MATIRWLLFSPTQVAGRELSSTAENPAATRAGRMAADAAAGGKGATVHPSVIDRCQARSGYISRRRGGNGGPFRNVGFCSWSQKQGQRFATNLTLAPCLHLPSSVNRGKYHLEAIAWKFSHEPIRLARHYNHVFFLLF
jgi:hypothetical protein